MSPTRSASSAPWRDRGVGGTGGAQGGGNEVGEAEPRVSGGAGALEQDRHPGTDGRRHPVTGSGDGAALDADVTGVGGVQQGEDAGQGGLAAAGGPTQFDGLAGGDVQVDPVEDPLPTIGDGHLVGREPRPAHDAAPIRWWQATRPTSTVVRAGGVWQVSVAAVATGREGAPGGQVGEHRRVAGYGSEGPLGQGVEQRRAVGVGGGGEQPVGGGVFDDRLAS